MARQKPGNPEVLLFEEGDDPIFVVTPPSAGLQPLEGQLLFELFEEKEGSGNTIDVAAGEVPVQSSVVNLVVPARITTTLAPASTSTTPTSTSTTPTSTSTTPTSTSTTPTSTSSTSTSSTSTTPTSTTSTSTTPTSTTSTSTTPTSTTSTSTTSTTPRP